MTESEWLRGTEPKPMLEFLRDAGGEWDRKLRLFAAACCRRIWHLLDPKGQATVETSERFADGLASAEVLKATIEANRGCLTVEARAAVDSAAIGAWLMTEGLLAFCAPSPGTDDSAAPAEGRVRADLLRCVIGPLPFRAPRLDPSWRTPLVLSLAEAAYEERVAPDPSCPGWLTLDGERLLVVADALEEAGADGGEMLEHLRGAGEHVRGCWCVDLLLVKE